MNGIRTAMRIRLRDEGTIHECSNLPPFVELAMTRYVAAWLFALTLSLGAIEPAHSQAALLGPGAAFLGAGASRIATAELDDRLAGHGLPTLGRTAVVVGIVGYRRLSNGLLIGFEWQRLHVGESGHGGGAVGVEGGYATLGIGYVVDVAPSMRLYPRLGIGGGGLTVSIKTAATSFAFDEVLADPRHAPELRESLLSRDGFVVDLGAGVEFLPRPGGGPLIGLRLGYLATRFDSHWDYVRHGRTTDGPDATISGPYVRVMVGGAWRR